MWFADFVRPKGLQILVQKKKRDKYKNGTDYLSCINMAQE